LLNVVYPLAPLTSHSFRKVWYFWILRSGRMCIIPLGWFKIRRMSAPIIIIFILFFEEMGIFFLAAIVP